MAARCISKSCTQLTASSSSAARAFLQIAPRRCLSTTPPPVLEFLLPSVAMASRTMRIGAKRLSTLPSTQVRREVKRAFTTSARRQETVAIYNPQKDDDGNVMHIEITPRASKRLKEIMAKDKNPNLALRIQVESGGCHGFQYLMSLTTLPPLSHPASGSVTEEASPALNTSSSDPNAISSTLPEGSTMPAADKDEKMGVLEEDDTVFGTEGETGAKVVMNTPSLDLLKGSKVDFTMELIGSQFKIVDNPLATSNCGCGTSFDIKI